MLTHQRLPYKPDVLVQDAIVDHFATRIVDDATGVADGDICIGEPPRARYYLATLAPRKPTDQSAAVSQDRDANSAMGFEFEIEPGSSLRIEAECSVYYKVLPTYEEQTSGRHFEKGSEPGAKTRGVPRIPLRNVYRHFAVAPVVVEASIGSDILKLGEADFAVRFEAATDQSSRDPRRFKRISNVPIAELSSEVQYEDFLKAQNGEMPNPSWGAHIHVLPRRSRDGRQRVSIMLVNDSAQPMRRVANKDVQDDDLDHFLFRASLKVSATSGAIRPIMLDLGPDAYRYNGALAAYALSCGVDAPGWNGTTTTIPALNSLPAPRERTFRVNPIDDDAIRRATSYEGLENDPLPLLKSFAADLDAYAHSQEVWGGRDLTEGQRAYLEIDHQRAIQEARRFRAGIGWLERDARLLLAFRLANRTMLQLAKQSGRSATHTHWRGFQLVAIVCELNTLAWREFPADQFSEGLWGENNADPTNVVTIVYFPTGGGKTESYLGMTACAMFYDRLRGKGHGLTTICRFPLKVLTLDQCDRLVDFVAAAEKVRTDATSEIRAFKSASEVSFEVGLLIGSDDVPNRISETGKFAWLQQPEVLERIRVVDRCPYCRKRAVELRAPTEPELRLDHVCRECGKRLPIMVTDGEVYRYLPCLVVSTIDKLALIGLAMRFGILLGDVDCKCDLHGYSRGLRCVEKELCYKLKGNVEPLPTPLLDPWPTFEVVDELHLLNEDLGAFDGHYETALAEIQKSFSMRVRPDGRGVRMKVVATTATIRGEDRQVAHLFGLRSVVTPTAGPRLNETFFWRRNFNEPLRTFLGIQPSHGKTAEMTVVRLLGVLHALIQDMQSGERGDNAILTTLPKSDYDDLVELYRRSLTYTTSLVDLGKLYRSIPTQVNSYLVDRGYIAVNFEMLYSGTSREGIGELRRIIDALQNPEGTVDGVIATSSVSHGLDIQQLNLMLFNGMPKSIAEYIQASSRVGRVFEGLVIMIYNPVRERDRSHFRYHGKFHQYVDRMVAPVAINRWSRFAGVRTFPGIFMAYVLQTLCREWWDAGNAPRHLHQLEQMQLALNTSAISGAQSDRIKAEIVRYFAADCPEAAELRAWLEVTVDQVIANLRMAAVAMGGTRGGPEYRATADYLNMGEKPMISLRDVDEGCAFVPKGGTR